MSARRDHSRPLGALVSQGVVAGASLVLQVIALRELGASGLGSFSLLFGILITVNSIQSGWIGDSLTVLDRFEPGLRRALIESQVAVVVLVGTVTTVLALPVGGVDATTAVLFGLASVMWVLEETIRRLLIARREFWKLVANDVAFAVGSLGLVGVLLASGQRFTLQTLVLALLSGAVVAIAVGVLQLPRIELSRGLLGPSRMRRLASFAVWRAAQIGLRPGSLAVVRAVVAAAISLEALGRLETARLLLAPILTAVSGAGVYLLPTYSAQFKRRARFRPAVPAAMVLVGAMAAGYGVLAVALRAPLAELLTDGTDEVAPAAIIAWTLFAVGFGAGIAAGNAMVAQGRSRAAFTIRAVDAAVGVAAAALFAAVGWVDAVPAGLALGALVGAVALARRVERTDAALAQPDPATAVSEMPPPVALYEAEFVSADDERELVWAELADTATTLAPPPPPPARTPLTRAERRPRAPEPAGPAGATDGPRTRLLWLLPLVLIVATEYKVRRRSIDDALAGSIDPMIAAELGVYALVGVWVVWWLAPRRPRLTPLTVLMWGYVLTTAVSAIYAEFPMLALARAVQLVIIGAAVHSLAADGTLHTIGRLVHGWLVLITASIAIGIAYVAPTSSIQEGRFTWLYVHSVSAGSMLALSVPMLFGLWLAAGRVALPWGRGTYGVLLAVHLVFLLLTRTRGSIGGAVVALAVMAWIWSGQRMKPQLVLASLVGAGALALAFGGPILEFVTRGETVESIGTFNRRTEIWSLAWQAFLENPLQGLGFTSADGVFFDETGLGGAHNAVINVMIDTGLPGLLWWCALIGGSIAVLVRLRGADRRARTPQPGALGTARADLVVLVGLFVASLLNSVTTEGLGAGVNVSAIWLFLTAAWLTILDRTPPHRDDVSGEGELVLSPVLTAVPNRAGDQRVRAN